jgi:hypothetical protein
MSRESYFMIKTWNFHSRWNWWDILVLSGVSNGYKLPMSRKPSQSPSTGSHVMNFNYRFLITSCHIPTIHINIRRVVKWIPRSRTPMRTADLKEDIRIPDLPNRLTTGYYYSRRSNSDTVPCWWRTFVFPESNYRSTIVPETKAG